jgi:hypothetical protein
MQICALNWCVTFSIKKNSEHNPAIWTHCFLLFQWETDWSAFGWLRFDCRCALCHQVQNKFGVSNTVIFVISLVINTDRAWSRRLTSIYKLLLMRSSLLLSTPYAFKTGCFGTGMPFDSTNSKFRVFLKHYINSVGQDTCGIYGPRMIIIVFKKIRLSVLNTVKAFIFYFSKIHFNISPTTYIYFYHVIFSFQVSWT